MFETPRQNSILSYAGLSMTELLSAAKQAFAQADANVPERFATFLPIFPFELVQNMSYLEPATGNRTSPLGFSLDPREYHRQLYEQLPDLYKEDNYYRNFDYEGRYQGHGVFTVDQAWAAHFPQFSAFMGEKLMIHLIGGGHQAVALPESLYPRGGGLLHLAERRMEITARAEQFSRYVKTRVSNGDTYDAEAFGFDYLAMTGLNPVMLRQKELGRILQDLSIARSLQNSRSAPGLFTESAKRVESLCQYVPWRYACDTFEAIGVSRRTARLFQPCFTAHDFISDLWMPYEDLNSYINKETLTVDMARLCESYQIAAMYDPDARGGRYPDALRVIAVRDREVPMMMGDVLNNPAYGGGMNPMGMIGRQVFIPDSRELLRQRKLVLEETALTVKNAFQTREAYLRGMLRGTLQEYKGRLVDAMYRREAALSQMIEGTRAYEKVRISLDENVAEARTEMQSAGSQWKHAQVSGYDADIDYLHRKYWSREEAQKDVSREPIPFSHDAQREQSIESGYAMRNNAQRLSYQDVCLPADTAQPPQEAAILRDSTQDERKEKPEAAPPSEEQETAVPEEESEAIIPEEEPETAAQEEELEATTPEEEPEAAAQEEELETTTPEEEPEAAAQEEELEATTPEEGPEAAVPEDERKTAIPVDAQQASKGFPERSPRKSATFFDLAQNIRTDPNAPKLAYIVRRDSEPKIAISNKDGKMASLLSDHLKEKPSS